MQCCSPTKSPRRCEASGKAKPFKGLFEPEDGFAARKALSKIGVGRYGFCRTGGAWGLGYCKCRNSISGIYNITRPNNACIARNAPPAPHPHTQKKRTQAVRAFHRLFICYHLYQSHLQLNSLRHAVLLSHHAAGGEPEDGFAARKALSQSE